MKIGWTIAGLALAVVIVGLAWNARRGAAQPPAGERRPTAEAQVAEDHAPLPQESLDRRARSARQLAAESVPVNAALPVIESGAEARRRSVEEVAARAMALLIVAVKAEGLEQARLDEIVARYRLSGDFTPEERTFLARTSFDDATRAKFSWRYEAAWVLLWALGYVDRLDRPDHPMDPATATTIMVERDRAGFIRDARLRPLAEILDQADLIYRYHWAVVDARIHDRPPPAGLNPDVVMERHQALNWLIGYMDQAWDDVTTDT